MTALDGVDYGRIFDNEARTLEKPSDKASRETSTKDFKIPTDKYKTSGFAVKIIEYKLEEK